MPTLFNGCCLSPRGWALNHDCWLEPDGEVGRTRQPCGTAVTSVCILALPHGSWVPTLSDPGFLTSQWGWALPGSPQCCWVVVDLPLMVSGCGPVGTEFSGLGLSCPGHLLLLPLWALPLAWGHSGT